MNKLLIRSAIRFFFKHPLQMALSVAGITVGVAVVVSIDLANASSSRAFELSMESVVGRATHQITGTSSGLPDSLFRFLKLNKHIDPVAPVIEKSVSIIGITTRTFSLIGVDAFSEKPFRSYLSSINNHLSSSLAAFIYEPSVILMSADAARQLHLKTGDSLKLKIGGNYKLVKLLGLLEAKDERSRNVLDNLLIADIATAQELLDMPGRISRIDLIIPENENQTNIVTAIKSYLPPDAVIIRSQTRSQIAADMVKAFDINLTALSLLALIVGMFLIYNTMTFSVVQRRNYIGLLRSIGVTKKEIFLLFLSEAFLLALAGSILGIFVGILLAQIMVQLVTQTINDLYFVLSIRNLHITFFSITKGLLAGTGAAVIAALRPAAEASSVAPRIAMNRSADEIKLRKRIPKYSLLGLTGLLVGVAILSIPVKSIVVSYVGILPVILGFSLLTPLMVILIIKLINLLTRRLFGMLGRMASRSIISQISRTAIAIAALSISVAATVGIGTMISSFRTTVVTWLEGNLEADIFISPPGLVLRQIDTTLDPELVKKILGLNEVTGYNYYREITLNIATSEMRVLAFYITPRSYKDFKFKEGDPNEIWEKFDKNDIVIVTEPYAYKNSVKTGDIINIPTQKGIRSFTVAGIYYDYSSDIGAISMSFQRYKRYWNDQNISGLSLFLADPTKRDSLIRTIRAMAPPDQEILVRSNYTLKKASMETFDRTFLITNVLQVLAVIVAFIGILSALMQLQLERGREFAVLRANGLTPGQLWKLISLQTSMMGIISGILALPLGNTLAWILIYIINKRSFGWTLQFTPVPGIMLQAVIIALIAALLGGLYPALKISRTSPARALREE